MLTVCRVRFFESSTDAGTDRDSQLGRSGEQLTETFGSAVSEGTDHGGHPRFAQHGEGNPDDTVRSVAWSTPPELVGNAVSCVPTPLRSERLALVVEALPAGRVARAGRNEEVGVPAIGSVGELMIISARDVQHDLGPDSPGAATPTSAFMFAPST